MKDVVEYLVRYLVDRPEAVRVQVRRGKEGTVYLVEVAPEDKGRLIGKGGGSLSPSAPWSGRTPSARWAWRCADAAAEGPGIMRVCAWWRSAGSAPLTP